MRKWNIKKAMSEEQVEEFLEDGWEPFGIEQIYVRGSTRSIYMWFKKEVPLLLKAPKKESDEPA